MQFKFRFPIFIHNVKWMAVWQFGSYCACRTSKHLLPPCPCFGGQRQHLCEVHLPAGRWMFTAAGGIFLAPMLPGARQALSCMTEHKRLTSERAVEVADRAHDEICVCSVCFSLLWNDWADCPYLLVCKEFQLLKPHIGRIGCFLTDENRKQWQIKWQSPIKIEKIE